MRILLALLAFLLVVTQIMGYTVSFSDPDVNKVESAKYIADMEKVDGVVKTSSGLLYKVVSKGNGSVSPKASDRVKVHYEGKLIDGKVFDSSYARGAPATFGVNQVIKGWIEGLQLMKVGDVFELFIEPNLAYSVRGAGGAIPSNSAIMFKVELLEIVGVKNEL